MRIKSVSFTDHLTGWNVKNVHLGALTLLVGASGVGKTLILRVISTIADIARGSAIEGKEWHIEFSEADSDYIWHGRFGIADSKESSSIFEDSDFSIENETLMHADGRIIFVRDTEKILYNDQPTVKLDSSKSAIELLKEEARIAPIHRGFKKISWLKIGYGSVLRLAPGLLDDNQPMSLERIKNTQRLSPIDRLYLISQHFPTLFKEIESDFREIFTTVESIGFEIDQFFKRQKEIVPLLCLKETGVKQWIKFPNISAGMYKTLSHLVTLKLADDGDVILIDEFENGLGINCIDQLAESALEPDRDVQIIMTSHHPYIINTIPFNDWLIISRKGSNVCVQTAQDLKIGEFSKHDAFMQLMQNKAFTNGQL